MYNITIPKDAQSIIECLEKQGHTAYIVGGCVRDSILGKIPNDFDLCTSAIPDEMKSILHNHKTYDTGLKHGTITVAGEDDKYEVTTYRVDGEYSDNRHPEKVEFVKNVELDLARRDFTINAMAYNNKIGLVDPFNGIMDIERKLIRCVGNPNDRFQEDALRILRAIRFASTYGFTIDNETDEAIHKNKHLLKNISEERKTSEFCKLLPTASIDILMKYKDVFAEFIPEIKPMFNFNQKTKWHCYDVYEHTVRATVHAPKDDLIVKLAVFFHDIGKPESFTEDENGGHFYGHPILSEEITEKVMRRMKFDNATIKNVLELVLNHDNRYTTSEKCAKRLLRDFGEEQVKRLLVVQECDKSAQSKLAQKENYQEIINIIKENINKAIKNKECFKIRDLAVNGYDLKEQGLEGIEIGKMLNTLLEKVIQSPELNNKEALLNFVKNFEEKTL